MKLLLGLAGLVGLAWWIVSRVREDHSELPASVVDRLFRNDEAKKRARDLVETRVVQKPSVSDGPPTKALSRSWDQGR